MEVLTGTSRYLTVPFAALAVSMLVLRGSLKRVEYVPLALSAIFVAYIFPRRAAMQEDKDPGLRR